MRLNVDVSRDDETGLFFTSLTDIPGLAVEAESYDALVAEVEQLTLLLLRENRVGTTDDPIVEISYTTHHQATLAL